MCSCDAKDLVACTAAALGWQAFETPMPRYFADAVSKAGHGLVLDVGANTGYYSFLALAVSRAVCVIAYEPLPSARTILAANRRMCPDRRRMTISAAAASDTAGPRRLFIPDAGHGLVETSASLSDSFKQGAGTALDITAIRLDDEHRGSQPVRIIKIDAESQDYEVVDGAREILRRDRPIVFIEVLLGAREDALTGILRDCDYVDQVLLPEGATEPATLVRHHTRAWNHKWTPRERFS